MGHDNNMRFKVRFMVIPVSGVLIDGQAIDAEAVKELEENVSNIDFKRAAEEERTRRHDVMVCFLLE